MMAALGPHAAFIVAAYAAAAGVMLALLVWVVADYYAQRATLDELERQGVTRRSARKGADAAGDAS
ncbi:MAG: heme exporter protein CcmD [Variibacter sp.]|nr:heme exporter protein CcmD [Variibacter sp.]